MTYTPLVLELLEAARDWEGRARLFHLKAEDEFQAVRAERLARLLNGAGSTLIANNITIAELKHEIEGLRSFKHSVDQALNSGNGSYRP